MTEQHQDLLGQLASIRERQGLEPLPDPTKIQGPPPVYDPVAERLAEARSYPEDHLESPEPEVFDEHGPSPLVKIAQEMPAQYLTTTVNYAWSPPDVASATIRKDDSEVVICDRHATYKNRPAELNDSEYKAIVRILIGALKRSVNDLEAEAGTKRIRVRKKAEEPKRRGRAAKTAGAAGNPVGKA